VTRFSSRWLTAILLSAFVVTIVRAQVGDDEDRKRAAFLKSRQSHSDSSDSTDESPTPRPKKPKPKAQKSPAPHSKASPSHSKASPAPGAKGHKKPSPGAKKSAHPSGSPSPTRKAAKKASPAEKEMEESRKRTPSPSPAETPAPRQSSFPSRGVPQAVAVAPTPVAPVQPNDSNPGDSAELTIEKSGYEKPRGFWYRVFHGSQSGSGRGAASRFLTAAVRAEIDRAPADRRNPPWQFIVVHNSGTRQGNARVFDYYHRHVRHMQNGLAYHFVIGNGTSTGNGQIEVGDRWRRQINGGHVHSDNLNNIALGICLVGDFNRSQPTAAQLQSCEELIRYLRQRCGKVGNHYMVVKPHREMNPPRWATDCPGDAFPYSWFRRFQ
jgi:N-acetylmuramoyl-L-alanine amidase-like protein